MHKTLYIDVDEEITSIIDRVRKSAAGEVIIIAPKQALLLQSLVNLKLLQKEVSRRGKKMMIVTQDKTAKKLIEKAGILALGKIDDSTDVQGVQEDFSGGKRKKDIEKETLLGEVREEENLEIGSDRYFDEPLRKEKEKSGEENIGQIYFGDKKDFSEDKASGRKKESQVSGKKTRPEKKTEKRVKISDIVAGPKQKTESAQEASSPKRTKRDDTETIPKTSGFYGKAAFGTGADRKTDQFFGEAPITALGKSRRKEKILKTEKVKGRTSRYFFLFSVVFLALAVVAGAYFFLPKAAIIIYPQKQEKTVSVNLEASSEANEAEYGPNVIPAVLEQVIAEKEGEFSAGGRKSGGEKAKGKLVIYNEFSSENQSLVATTRFETSDGKIFRITKNTTVPGMTKVGSETKPGAVEVEVAADKIGKEYNTGPTTFKIPGFKGGPKYEKFYAKSSEAMSGGADGENPTVTSQDIAEAKEKMTAEAKNEAVRQLKETLPEERKFFIDTITTEIMSAAPSVNAGAETEKFSLTAKVKAKTLSFSEEDVKELMKKQLEQEGSNSDSVKFEKAVNYILVEKNEENKFVKFEAKTDLEVGIGINLENFRKGSLGKNAAELEALVKTYPSVQKADVSFWPFFVSRIPMNESKVKIEVR